MDYADKHIYKQIQDLIGNIFSVQNLTKNEISLVQFHNHSSHLCVILMSFDYL